MSITLTMSLAIDLPDGEIIIDVTGVGIDRPGARDAALDMVRRLITDQAPAIAVAVEEQHAAPKPTPEASDAATPTPAPAPAPAPAKPTGPAEPPEVGEGDTVLIGGGLEPPAAGTVAAAIVDHLAEHGAHVGSIAGLAAQLGHVSTSGSRKVTIGKLIASGHLIAARASDGRSVLSIRLPDQAAPDLPDPDDDGEVESALAWSGRPVDHDASRALTGTVPEL